ncbi:zinc finger protein 862-like [Oculina patagonica]
MMHCENTKEMRIGSSGRQGRAAFSVKFLTSFKGLLFTSFLWDIAEAAAHLSKVFQAEFLTVTTAAAAVRKFEMECLNMKLSDGPKVKAFLKEVGGGKMFRDIALTRDDSDLSQFQKVKLSVVDEVCQSTSERFQYLFNDPVIKASSVFDPDTWPGDPEELAFYADDQLSVISDRYREPLKKAGFNEELVNNEWHGVKSLVSVMQHKKTNDIYSVLFKKHKDDFPNFLLIAEIVLTWPLSTAACERGFSSMNRTKTIQRSSLAARTLDNNLRISIKYHSLNKSERVQAFVQSGHLDKAVKHWRENSVRTRREDWIEKHPEAKTWSSLKRAKAKD